MSDNNVSTSFSLTPSQALKTNKVGGNNDSRGNSNTANTNNKGRNRNDNRKRRNNNKNNAKPPASTEGRDANPAGGKTAEIETQKGNENNNNGRKQRQRRQRGNKKAPSEKGDTSGEPDTNNSNASNSTDKKPPPSTAKRKPRKRKPKKKYPWRKHIPEGTVDPITLDNLDTLDYPPFALCADEPYIPVPTWPVPKEDPSGSSSINTNNKIAANEGTADSAEDLNRQRLADQWGEHLLPSKESNRASADTKPKASKSPPPLSERPLNLFDGRALAFYMVSQLQFIDPFTRRDLTRAELQNLDRYLDRYGSAGIDSHENKNKNKNKKQQKLKVTEAYDAKGITLSSAGAAAATAQGRADIMQQMAQQLLNSLFVGHPSVSSIPNSSCSETPSRRQQAESFSLQEQYAVMQRQERAAAQAGERQYETVDDAFLSTQTDEGFGGFMIIDDDVNPELRGRGHNDFPSLEAATPQANEGPAVATGGTRTPFVSSWQSTDRRSANEAGAFPALPKPKAEASSSTKAISKKSKTLAKMFKVVKKTTAEEKQSQWEAREVARRKAVMSNLTYGMNPVVMDPSRSLLEAPSAASVGGSATEEQLQRNKAFADALGVKSSTQRHYASGWARPTNGHDLPNELEAVLYPDALIQSAKDHSRDFLLKLEKRWKRFLNDDKAASLPLNRMDKKNRKLAHHYAEFWHLKTESFDPEPNRYIHCVKLQDTCMPLPLLSDVAQHWRGPSIPDATRTIASVMNDHTLQQTAGQSSKSSSEPFEAAPKLRSALAMSSSKGDLVALGETAVQNSRSNVLMDKQRPQLKLRPRTVPLELPPFEEQLQQEAEEALALEEDLRRRQVRLEEKRRKEREIEQKKKHILEDAFASDDESNEKQAAFSDNDSEWGDDQEALFDGSDEE